MLETDAKARVHPGLLAGWRLLSDTAWEFKLRPGVRFHNGAPFVAEDIAFTIARLPTIQTARACSPPTPAASAAWRWWTRRPSASTPPRPTRPC